LIPRKCHLQNSVATDSLTNADITLNQCRRYLCAKTPLDLALAEWPREVIAGRSKRLDQADRKPPHRLTQPLSALLTQAAIHVFGRGRPVTAAGWLNWVASGLNEAMTPLNKVRRKSHSRKELGKPSTITRVQHWRQAE
jgi:hypothetical protein